MLVMACESIILTDTSENLDAPLTEDALSLYDGGTTMSEAGNGTPYYETMVKIRKES